MWPASVDLTGRFSEAVAYALAAHHGQRRTGTEVPYASHLLAVAVAVLEHGGTELQATAAVLHDVVEDQGGAARLVEVGERFGDEVAELVELLSDEVLVDGAARSPWAERKRDHLAVLARLVAEDHPAALVALCDKLHNADAIVADAEDPGGPGDAVWDRFSGGRAEIAWYYRTLAEVFAGGRLPARAVRRFTGLVRRLEVLATGVAGEVQVRPELDHASAVPVSEQLAEALRAEVCDGLLPPRARLPSVRALAAELGLAPNTVAKVYRQLESEGVVETRGRQGTRVAGATPPA